MARRLSPKFSKDQVIRPELSLDANTSMYQIAPCFHALLCFCSAYCLNLVLLNRCDCWEQQGL